MTYCGRQVLSSAKSHGSLSSLTTTICELAAGGGQRLEHGGAGGGRDAVEFDGLDAAVGHQPGPLRTGNDRRGDQNPIAARLQGRGQCHEGLAQARTGKLGPLGVLAVLGVLGTLPGGLLRALG